ncbi:LON domain serine protease [Ceratobasidium sp. AG-Ba]|nr:LON domain serine protease [Ceratobasidium sp. AG-Ba]
MSFPRTLAKSQTQPTSAPLRPTPSATLNSEATNELRRSQREHSGGAKLVPDEYEASQHESEPRPQSKPNSKSKKSKSSKRGNRPGLIIQPGPAGDRSSQGPTSEARSDAGDSHVASPAAGETTLKTVDRAEAVRRASSILGADASRYSSSTLKQIITSGEEIRQDAGSGPMEVETGDPPFLWQSPKQVGLGSGRGSSSRGTTHGAATAQGWDEEPAGMPESPALEPPEYDTNTEPKSDSDHLRPEDSVSQRIPPAPRAQSSQTRLAPNIRPKSLQSKRTGSASGSNIELEEETVRSLKRQRTLVPPRLPLPPRPSLPTRPTPARPSIPRPTSLPARSHISPPPVAPEEPPLLDEPPQTSDISAVLAWAVRTAKQASTLHHVTATGQPDDTYQILATVLDNLQRSYQVSSAPRASSSARQATEAKENAAVLEAEAALVLGQQASRKRANLRDFPGLTGHVAALMIPKLIATTVTKGAYGTHDILAGITGGLFTEQWKEELPDLRVQKPPVALISLLVHRISWARGQAKARICPNIPSDYGFINPPRNAEDVRFNRKRAKSLLPNAFHCRGLKTDVHPYEHEALSHCIASAFFWAADSMGMVYHHLFYPVPIPTVAMALTKMQHCISEWTTGRYVSRSLDIDKQRKIYEAHLAGLANFGKDDPDCLRNMQIDWFWYGVDYAGGSLEDQEPVQPVTWADRVGAVESDPEFEAEAEADSSDDLYD